MLFSKQSMQSFAKQRSATFFINRRVKTDHKTRAFWVFQKPARKEAPMQTNSSNKGTVRAFPREWWATHRAVMRAAALLAPPSPALMHTPLHVAGATACR